MINIHPSDKPAILMGSLGGIVTSLCNIKFAHDLLQNMCIAAAGAVASFAASYILNLIFKKWKR